MDQRQHQRRDDDRWYRELIDNLADLVCRYRTDTTILYVNKAYADYFGVQPEDLVGRSYLEFVVESARPEAQANTERLAVELTPAAPTALTEHASAFVGGELRWLQWSDRALFEDGRLVGFVSVGRDVTARRRAEEEARHRATYDALTGLHNRHSIFELLEAELTAMAAEPDRSVGLLYLDVDDFKAFNDDHGHRYGDAVLRTVADGLTRLAGPEDRAGRLGGDEFVLLCPACPSMAALLEKAACIERELSGGDPPVPVSVGAVLARPDDGADDLLHRADLSMYERKAGRRRNRPEQPAA
ncbi:MAG: diguanylate cyclase [Acidimicrobiia bacterium]